MAESRTCKECGFLTIQGRELSRPERIMLASHGTSAVMPAHPEQTRCFRTLWDYDLHYFGDTFDGVIEEIERSRDDCPDFMPYEAGFTPAQHLEIHLEQRKAEGRGLKATPDKKSDLLAQLAETEKFPDAQEEKKEISEEGSIFCKEGDAWKVSFDGITVPNIKHSKGMDYLKYLLENPNRHIAVLTLIQTPLPSEGASQLAKMNEDQLEELGLTKSSSLGYKEEISKETKEKFKKRIHELEEIINEQESLREEVTKAQNEKKELIKQLKASHDKSADKPRTAVSNAIKRAITHIRKHHSSLAEHLEKNIHLGYSCIYTPLIDPNWNT